jgi:hypothetical protein
VAFVVELSGTVALLLALVALEVSLVVFEVELAGIVALLVSLLGMILSLVEFPATDVALETGVALQL